ncbi:hypothetical protein BFJ70_g8364 [Fusarium oxysporum]|nr:hypothetical protein BFJ70_g8364 [Fusarium oxysporum]
MKLSTLIPITFLFGSALADLHNFCGCGKRFGKNAVQDAYWTFDTAATRYACDRYARRNTGNKQWDKCPDCKMDTYHLDGWVGTPACFSWGFHLGGDEWDHYCGHKGLQGYCANAD